MDNPPPPTHLYHLCRNPSLCNAIYLKPSLPTKIHRPFCVQNLRMSAKRYRARSSTVSCQQGSLNIWFTRFYFRTMQELVDPHPTLPLSPQQHKALACIHSSTIPCMCVCVCVCVRVCVCIFCIVTLEPLSTFFSLSYIHLYCWKHFHFNVLYVCYTTLV